MPWVKRKGSVLLSPATTGRSCRNSSRPLNDSLMVLVVGHDLTNLTAGYGGPKTADVLYTPADLVADLDGLAIERAERVIRPVEDEDGTHQAIDALVRGHRPA